MTKNESWMNTSERKRCRQWLNAMESSDPWSAVHWSSPGDINDRFYILCQQGYVQEKEKFNFEMFPDHPAAPCLHDRSKHRSHSDCYCLLRWRNRIPIRDADRSTRRNNYVESGKASSADKPSSPSSDRRDTMTNVGERGEKRIVDC